jgi:hypothetical protein
VEGGAIASLLGSVRGVKKVEGAGPTSGGADQDDERRLRALVPAAGARVRACGLERRPRRPGARLPRRDARGRLAGHRPARMLVQPDRGVHLALVRAGSQGCASRRRARSRCSHGILDARATSPFRSASARGAARPGAAADGELAVDPRRPRADVVAAATAALDRPGRPAGAAQPRARPAARPLATSFALLHAVRASSASQPRRTRRASATSGGDRPSGTS